MIVELTIEHARHIAHHLRWTWAREVAAGLPSYGTAQELDEWAERLVSLKNTSGMQSCALCVDGQPAVMGGIVQQGHIGMTWVAGTDRVDEVRVEFVRACLRMQRDMQKRGVRRFVSTCLDGPDELFSWLIRLGYQLEGRHPGMGIHGDTYLTFGKVIDHV